MKLSTKQQRFSIMLAMLTLYAASIGLGLTQSRGYVSKAANDVVGGDERSLHLSRLAQDWNVYKDGIWLRGQAGEDAHNLLHDFWDTLGGAERIEKDLNHYSLAHWGMR